MKYKVHRLEIKMENDQNRLEQYLNILEGEVVSIIPNVKPFFLLYGSKVNSILIVEKIK